MKFTVKPELEETEKISTAEMKIVWKINHTMKIQEKKNLDF